LAYEWPTGSLLRIYRKPVAQHDDGFYTQLCPSPKCRPRQRQSAFLPRTFALETRIEPGVLRRRSDALAKTWPISVQLRSSSRAK